MNLRAQEAPIPKPQGVRHRYFTFKRLVRSSPTELKAIHDQGMMPSLEQLEGWEFRGCNTGKIPKILGFQKFKKGFYRDDTTPEGQLYGYNIPVEQNATFDPHVALPCETQPKRFGFYNVTPARTYGPDCMHHNGLLLDYGSGPYNPTYDPTRMLRDYLVQVDPDNPDLLLGNAYLALGNRRVFVGYFVLERYNQIGL